MSVQGKIAESGQIAEQTAPGVSGHTPTPWSVWEPIFFEEIAIIGGDGFRVAVTSNGNKDRSRREHKANAAFIVRVVNSHDALVKALEEIAALESRVLSRGPELIKRARHIAKCALASSREVQP